MLDLMRPKVYLETTIPSYLTARRSRDLVVAAHQEITMDWWTGHRNRFDLFVSILVLEEVARGEQNVAALRMAQLEGLATLEMTEEARELARQFVIRGLLPAKAFEDALHVAIATIQGMDYLLTWNCRHIANAEIAGRMATLAEELGYEMPTLCTPEQLMGD